MYRPLILAGLAAAVAIPILASCVDRGKCLRSHTETRITFVHAGAVLIPINTVDTVCDEWEFPDGKK